MSLPRNRSMTMNSMATPLHNLGGLGMGWRLRRFLGQTLLPTPKPMLRRASKPMEFPLNRPSRRLPLLALFTFAVPLACARTPGSGPARTNVAPESQPAPVTVLAHPALTQAGAAAANIADIAERALPSVVNISLTKLAKIQGQVPFPFFFGPGQGPDPRERREQQGMGSGVVVSKDGYVLTNNHVVSEAQQIKVTLFDKREFDAEVVGTDPKSDIAVIRLKSPPADLRPIEMGDSSRIRLGDVVLAIGNPFGVGQTVTMGIVSAKGRADVGIVDYEDFIQTDAAINPGNSGGALVNMEGKLIGINTAILSRSGGFQGIGFAIPTNMVSPIMESLKKYGKVTRGWLGVSIQDVDQDLATTMKLPTTRGVLLSDVQAGSPAQKAGLRRGDVVVKIDGQAVETTGHFRNAIAAGGSGKKVNLELYREGKLQSLQVSLGEAPQDPRLAGGTANGPAPSGGLDGLSLSEMTPEVRQRLELPSDAPKGLAVLRVAPGTPAAKAGLRPGDVLMEVNRKPVATVKEFEDLYGKSKGNVLLLLYRQGATVFVVVRR
jgi:serine protease Do